MPKPTRDEIVDKAEVRRDIYKEARRLSKKPEVKAFIEGYCRLSKLSIVSPDGGRGERWTYEIKGRQQTRLTNAFKQIIRDNLLPAFKNGKTPLNWNGLEEKIDELVPLLLATSVPQNKRPQRPLKPLPPRGGQGNQGGGPPT